MVAASDNFSEVWSSAVGVPIAELIGEDVFSEMPEPVAANARYLGQIQRGSLAFDVFIHSTYQGRVVELERAALPRPTAIEVLEQMIGSSVRIAEAQDMLSASQAAAEAVRDLTGYDRVMVYRFLDDDSGEVIAEARSHDIDPLLNHRYPASDIPRQARALYLTNPIRVIPNVSYAPVPLQAEQEPIDLSGALLRSVSPVHIQYLKNMEVGASASVSVVHDGQLWGLIACHHRSPQPIGHERREMARQVAVALQAAIHRLEEDQSQREELLPELTAAASVREGLVRNIEELMNLIPAHGLALVIETETTTVGVTPPESAMEELAEWLVRPSAPAICATSWLINEYQPAEEWTAHGSGLLSLVISRNPTILVMWFAPRKLKR